MSLQVNTVFLEHKWSLIPIDGIEGFRVKRISPDSKLDINIGYNRIGDRCLVLELPSSSELVFFNRIKQNLSICYLKEQNYIVIELLVSSFNDLFCDLIVSLYHRVKNFEDIDSCTTELVSSFGKWSEFFNDQTNQLLTDEMIKGIWGELFVLREMLRSTTVGTSVDQILEFWQGPYDRGHDFILADKNLEVKTKDVGAIDITISSEHQLELEFMKPLELLVLSVDLDLQYGENILEVVESIRDEIRLGFGDASLLLTALAQKGLHMRNLDFYPKKYKAINQIVYDCVDENFPKLVVSSLPAALNQVRYRIRTAGLEDFIINQKDY